MVCCVAQFSNVALNQEASDGSYCTLALWDSPSCSAEWSGVPSLPEMTLGLFQAGDLKGLTHPFIILRASQEPQERQDSYLALSALCPEHLLV